MDSWRHGDEKYANAIGQFVAYTGLHIALFRAGTIIFMQDIERGRMGKLKDMGRLHLPIAILDSRLFSFVREILVGMRIYIIYNSVR